MKSMNRKNISSVSLIFLVAVSAPSFLWPSTTHALSCLFPKSIFIASYQEGALTDGFVVRYLGTGNSCDTRPVVDENKSNVQNIFSFALRHLGQEVSTGVYQLTTRCGDKPEHQNSFEYIWDQYCKDTRLEQLSNNPAALARYKSEWKTKGEQNLRSTLIEKWTAVLIMIVIVAIAIIWPWILLRRKKDTKNVNSLFALAIIVQVILAFLLIVLYVPWSFALWALIATVSSLSLLGSVVVEVGYLIYRKIRMRKLDIS